MKVDEKCPKCGAGLLSYLKDDHWKWECGSGFYLPSRCFVQSLECKKLQCSKSHEFFSNNAKGQLGLLVKDCQSPSDKFNFTDVDMYVVLRYASGKTHQENWALDLCKLAQQYRINIIVIVDKVKDTTVTNRARCSFYLMSFAGIIAFEEEGGILKVTKDRHGRSGKEISI